MVKRIFENEDNELKIEKKPKYTITDQSNDFHELTLILNQTIDNIEKEYINPSEKIGFNTLDNKEKAFTKWEVGNIFTKMRSIVNNIGVLPDPLVDIKSKNTYKLLKKGKGQICSVYKTSPGASHVFHDNSVYPDYNYLIAVNPVVFSNVYIKQFSKLITELRNKDKALKAKYIKSIKPEPSQKEIEEMRAEFGIIKKGYKHGEITKKKTIKEERDAVIKELHEKYKNHPESKRNRLILKNLQKNPRLSCKIRTVQKATQYF